MLSEILFAAVKAKGKEPKPDRIPGLSCSGLFPCPYRMYQTYIGKVWYEDPTPQQTLNAEDGWDQENQSIQRLKDKAGIIVQDRQTKVSVGRSNIPGSIDGTVTLGIKKRLWEHKAMDSWGFNWFSSRGIDVHPDWKSQTNAYMLGMGLDECILFAKKKESNDYVDKLVKLDREFILPIIEWADRIRLDSWIPEPKLTEMCAHCRVGCFGTVIDFSWINSAGAPVMADRWRKGDALEKTGKMLKDEARLFFIGDKEKGLEGLMGGKNLLLVEGLSIAKIIQNRFEVSKGRVLDEFGPEGLMKVGEEKVVVFYRITDKGV